MIEYSGLKLTDLLPVAAIIISFVAVVISWISYNLNRKKEATLLIIKLHDDMLILMKEGIKDLEFTGFKFDKLTAQERQAAVVYTSKYLNVLEFLCQIGDDRRHAMLDALKYFSGPLSCAFADYGTVKSAEIIHRWEELKGK
jgi:hypothetical protein